MKTKKNIFAIVGSASEHSANLLLLEQVKQLTTGDFNLSIFTGLKALPHFDPELSGGDPPAAIVQFRNGIANADGVIICTPEYVFSIPSGLKNALEWCVATVIFADKPTGLITASASGVKGHEELLLIMKTLSAQFTPATTLLISGIKGKFNAEGELISGETKMALEEFIGAYKELLSATI